MHTPSVLIAASNLRVGGGVQVAASITDEVQRMAMDPMVRNRYPWIESMVIEVSPEVLRNLAEPVGQHLLVRVSERRWSDFRSWMPRRPSHALEYTVFGPRYGARRGRITMTGLADGTSVYPAPRGVARGSLLKQWARALRGFVSRRLFAREDYLVSESRALLEQFVERMRVPMSKGSVIPNVVNRAVLEAAPNQDFAERLRRAAGGARLFAYVARAYPHKNHGFLPALAHALREYGMVGRFVVTLTEEEWATTSASLREVCINVGVIPIQKVADLYHAVDAVIFPSLLESFSATPIEALATNGLLFASDREFVRETCGLAPVYFDPLDAQAAAGSIYAVMSDEDSCDAHRMEAAAIADGLPTAHDRARAIISAIDEALASEGDADA